MTPDTTMVAWVVGFVATSVVGTLGFLIRRAFAGVESALLTMGGKLDAMSESLADKHTKVTVLEDKVARLQEEMRDALRELRAKAALEGIVTNLQADVLEARKKLHDQGLQLSGLMQEARHRHRTDEHPAHEDK